MSLSLRYDPYSPNAIENYERLRAELEGIDILGLLNEQLARTNLHVPTTRKLIAAIAHLDGASQYGAVSSLLSR